MPLRKGIVWKMRTRGIVLIFCGLLCTRFLAVDAEPSPDQKEEQPIHVCGPDDVDDEDGCICEDDRHLISCDDVVQYSTSGDDEDDDYGVPLSSPNVNVSTADHTIVIATFLRNNIEVLKKGKVLKGHEGTLEELYFSYNKIKKIENGTFNDMKNLTVLDLGSNRLQSIRIGWFKGAQWKLKYLNLENNSLVSFPAEVFNDMKSLESLILDGNPRLFAGNSTFKFTEALSNLKNLSLSSCKLRNLTDDFFKPLKNLEVLSVADNLFLSFPKAVNIPSLLVLDLSRADFSEIDGSALSLCTNLQTFYCVDCEYLEMIQDCAFCGLSKLKEVDLEHCIQLYAIHEGAFGYGHKGKTVPKLEFLSIHDTNISSLSRRLFDSSNLYEFEIGETPWDCSCETSWILQLEVESFRGPKCESPSSLRDRPFNQLTVQELCPGRLKITKLVFSLFILLSACMIIVFIYYMSTNYRLRNIFYRPDMPHIGYRNLNPTEDEDQRGTNLPNTQVL